MKKKKLKPEIIEFNNLKVGDMVDSKYSRLFCFKIDNGYPSCLGHFKKVKSFDQNDYSSENYTRLTKPTKTFLKLCKRMLRLNLKDKTINNLDYIEAIVALKKYD